MRGAAERGKTEAGLVRLRGVGRGAGALRLAGWTPWERVTRCMAAGGKSAGAGEEEEGKRRPDGAGRPICDRPWADSPLLYSTESLSLQLL